ncbi:hypothetical protein RAC69_15790, partial [Microbacterium sp. LS_15]
MRSARHRRTLLTAALVVVLGLTPQAALAAAPDPSAPEDPVVDASAPPSTVWDDPFTRDDEGGWGDDYVSVPAFVASVQDGAGAIRIRGGHRSILSATTGYAADGVVGATLSFDRTPAVGYGATAIVTARNGESGSYGARFRLDTHSRGVLSIARYDVDDAQTVLRPDLLLLDEVPAGAAVRVEIETAGTDPVTIRARAWVLGTERPDWQISVEDAADEAVRSAGTSGITTYMSRGNRSLALHVDDLTVSSTDVLPVPVPEPEPSPEPQPTAIPVPSPEPTAPVEPTAEPTPSVEPSPVPTAEPSP